MRSIYLVEYVLEVHEILPCNLKVEHVSIKRISFFAFGILMH